MLAFDLLQHLIALLDVFGDKFLVLREQLFQRSGIPSLSFLRLYRLKLVDLSGPPLHMDGRFLRHDVAVVKSGCPHRLQQGECIANVRTIAEARLFTFRSADVLQLDSCILRCLVDGGLAIFTVPGI